MPRDRADFFPPMFPTPTAGDGLLRSNNLLSPRNPSITVDNPRKKVSCQQCGFLVDTSRVAASGGDLSGNGAFSGVTVDSDTSAGYSGEGNLQMGAGCPFCGSKNFSASRAGHIK